MDSGREQALHLQHDIEMYQGDTFGPLNFRLRGQAMNEDGPVFDEDDNPVPGDYLDLTGCTVTAQVRVKEAGSSLAITSPVRNMRRLGAQQTKGSSEAPVR